MFEMFPDNRADMEWFDEDVWPGGRKCIYKHICASKHPAIRHTILILQT